MLLFRNRRVAPVRSFYDVLSLYAGMFPSMSKKNRFIGFCVCFGLGMLLSILATLNIMNPVEFGIMYTLGNVVALFRCVRSHTCRLALTVC